MLALLSSDPPERTIRGAQMDQRRVDVDRLARNVVTAVLVAALSPALVAASTQTTDDETSAPVTSSGYLPLSDGTTLHYAIRLPGGDGPFPTLITYSGYANGFGPSPATWTDAGYARVSVTVRGAGCSGGTWDLFSPQQARDGVEVLRWVEDAPWSDDTAIALLGESYGAIMALLVAEEPGVEEYLDAVVAAHPMLDLYRDVLAPGGIPNVSVPAAFMGMQNWFSLQGATGAFDETCAANVAARGPSATNQPPLVAAAHPFDDATMRERSPGERLGDIDVPVFTAIAWQDDTLGSRPADILGRLDVPFRAVVGNGPHQLWYAALPEVLEFLDLHLRGLGDPPDSPITVWWEKSDGPGPLRGPVAWTTELGGWPAPQSKIKHFALDVGGRLVEGDGGGPPDQYFSGVPGQSQATDGVVTGLAGAPSTGVNAWSQRPGAGSSVAYTTAPFRRDLTVLGDASVDLWLSSTAVDTDLQVTLTEVRANGEEIFVQQGWLRASHRALDQERSTPTRPFHTHQLADVAPLRPGEPTPLRIEVLPFGHVFRAGSSLRLWVESPKTAPDLWAFAPSPAAVNTVHHDAAHPSAVVLSVLPGQHAQAAPPECGSPAIRQPCR